MEREWLRNLGFVASMVLPFFNLPLILHILQRRSSGDISLTWVGGVWICLLLMLPAAWLSTDSIFRAFSILNFAMFSLVTATVFYFRWKK